ncbi:hypothetical protein [Streptomyces sp. NPDC050535]|uniref:hypothetical protein n=1 Tax=Streptomyces sp. NPDC050535 TaxID=3365626 RepID=UPI0037AEB142
MPEERPFFVIGRWSGPDLTVWKIHEAPEDPEELNAACEEIRWDARDADGGVEIVYAASGEEAEATARREAAETAEQIRQDLKRQREQHSSTSRRPRRKVRHHYT